MDKHWSNFCTMSIVHFMAFPETMSGEGPIVETVKKIAEDSFFGAVEIGCIKDPNVRRQVKQIVESANIKVGHGAQATLLAGKFDLNSLDEGERRTAVKQLCSSIDEAAEIGAKRLAFLSGKDPGENGREQAFKVLAKSVKEAAAYGQEKHISLILETFDYDIDKKALIGPSSLAHKFCQVIREDFPDFGLMFDLSHLPLLHENSEEALMTLRSDLVHIHVGNAVLDPDLPGYGDMHPRFGFPGGCNNVSELANFIQNLFKIGYLSEDCKDRPWIGFEIKPQFSGETPEILIAGTKRVWAEAWARV